MANLRLSLRVKPVEINRHDEARHNGGHDSDQLEYTMTPERIRAPAIDTAMGLGVRESARIAFRHKNF